MDRERHVDLRRMGRLAVVLLAVAVWFLMASRAWLCDDSYITLRTVDNFISGHGLTWNIAERVQAYTHPLWMALLAGAYLVSREAYFTTITISLTVSAALVAVFVGHAARTGTFAVVCGLLGMLCSRAFIDFSTSGLENPLSHLVVVAFFGSVAVGTASPGSVRRTSFLASLALLNRPDLGLLLAPSLLARARTLPHAQAFRAVACGMTPFIVWEIFSMIYYGSPVANTVYAKLNTGLPAAWSLNQGLHYLVESFVADPATLVVIALAVGVAVRTSSQGAGLGMVLALLWIVWVGGDFMSGRFLTPVFAAAVTVLSSGGTLALGRTGRPLAIALLAVLLVLRIGWFDMRALVSDGHPMYRGIIDERSAYAKVTALTVALERGHAPVHPWGQDGIDARNARVRVAVPGPIGFFGYFCGPTVHVVDVMALADPLLARLPAREGRIGHFERVLPGGYIESLQADANRLQDRRLVAYYDDVRLVTRGPLWSWQRFLAIVRLNTSRPPRPSVRVG